MIYNGFIGSLWDYRDFIGFRRGYIGIWDYSGFTGFSIGYVRVIVERLHGNIVAL